MAVFFTGFPGFLGSRLLPRVAARRPGERIDCLVQERFFPLAEARLESLVRENGELAGRVRLLKGDITKPGMGLGSEAPRDVKELFHLAALYDLSARQEPATRVNVDGTRHALDLAAGCSGLERVHYVSTCYVSGSLRGEFRESDLECGQSFHNWYEETKYLAEVEVRRRMPSISATIYRPAIVVGDSATGETQKFDGPYYAIRWILKQPRIAIMPVMGNVRQNVLNVVPRDWVVDALDRLSGMERSRGRTYQLADPDPPTIAELLDLLEAASRRRLIRVRLPIRFAKWAIDSVPGVFRLLEIPSAVIDYFTHGARYDTTNARSDLAGTGMALPSLREYLPNLVSFVEHNRGVPSEAMA